MTQEQNERFPHSAGSAASLERGAVIGGRYAIVGMLGRGAMGEVFEGEHLELGNRVAIKVLPASGGADPRARERFKREARALAAVSHPHIVVVTDYGVHGEHPYLVMQRLEGQNLRSLLDAEAPLGIRRAVSLLQQLLAALQHAHERGLVHRDLKPANIWVEQHGDGEYVRVLDFGFAKFMEPEPGSENLTAGGIAVGTPPYMSPEQAGAEAVDHRSDLYAAGVLLFEMLTKRRPFEGTALEVVQAHMATPPPTLREARPGASFGPTVEAVVARALAKRPDDRYQSAGEMAADLARIVRGSDQINPPATAGPGGAGIPDDEITGETTAATPVRRSRALLGSVLAAITVGGLAAGLTGYWMSKSPPPRDAALVMTATAPEPAAPAAGGDEGDAVWTLWPEVAYLDAMRARVEGGGELSPEELRRLSELARSRPNDPRPELLRGVAYLERAWLSDSLGALRRAYHADGRIARHPRFRTGLIWLVRYENTTETAADLVAEIYGADAIDPATEVLEAARADERQAARLGALLERLRALPGR